VRKRARFVVRRHGRAYELCGDARDVIPERRTMFVPGAAMLLVLICAMCALVHGPLIPPGPQHELPLAQVDHYTVEDFFDAAH
jgi:hypothetical protein